MQSNYTINAGMPWDSDTLKQWAEQHLGPLKWKGSEGQGRCKRPTHDGQDKNPSFCFNVEKGTGHCFACDAAGEGMSVKELAAALGVPLPPVKQEVSATRPVRKIVKIYDYLDAAGTLRYQSCRFEPKGFSQRRPDGKGGYHWNLDGVDPLPYRLPEVLAALAAGKMIVICEGEKDANRLHGLGITATSNSGGAGKWTEKHSKYFATSAQILILPDNDQPGRSHAQAIARALHDRGCVVRVVELPGLTEKGDVSDWLDAGHTKEELSELAKAAPIWTPETAPEVAEEPAVDDWPEPLPLASPELPPVAPMPPEMLPEPFRAWLADIARRMQCPLDFVAVGAIVAASSVIGAGCGIRPKVRDDWEVICNLWGGPVARPSMMKTPSLAEVIKILARMEADEAETFEEMKRFHDAGVEALKAKKDALKSEMLAAAKGKKTARPMDIIQADMASMEPDEEVTRRRFKTNDATTEKLGELLNQNPRGLLVFRDELTGLLLSWDREDRQSDRAFFLEAWNGSGSFTTDRIGRGTVDIKNTCLSILGGIQPGKLQAYLLQAANNLTNDGMIQRFQLLVYPDEPAGWVLIDDSPDRSARDRATGIFMALAEMDFEQAGADGEEGERPFFHFDQAAQGLFYEWLTELEGKIRSEETPLLCEHFAKYRSLMPSLALVFHLIDVAGGASPGPVTAGAAAMAADWVDYLESHARRIYSLILDMGPRSAAALAVKIKEGKVNATFAARDVYRNQWAVLDTPELVAGACDELEALGWIRKESIAQTGGRPKVIFSVNPKIKS